MLANAWARWSRIDAISFPLFEMVVDTQHLRHKDVDFGTFLCHNVEGSIESDAVTDAAAVPGRSEPKPMIS